MNGLPIKFYSKLLWFLSFYLAGFICYSFLVFLWRNSNPSVFYHFPPQLPQNFGSSNALAFTSGSGSPYTKIWLDQQNTEEDRYMFIFLGFWFSCSFLMYIMFFGVTMLFIFMVSGTNSTRFSTVYVITNLLQWMQF